MNGELIIFVDVDGGCCFSYCLCQVSLWSHISLFLKMWRAAEKNIIRFFIREENGIKLEWYAFSSDSISEVEAMKINQLASLKAALHFLFSSSSFFDFVHFSFSCHILFSIHFSVVGLKLTDVLVSELIIKFVAASYTQHSKQTAVIFLGFVVYRLMAFASHLRANDWAGSKVCGNLMHSFENVKKS